MNRPSLGWRLLRWLVVFLVLVLVGFGSTLWIVTRTGTLDEVDVELRAAAEVVATKLKRKDIPWLKRRRPLERRLGGQIMPDARDLELPKSLASRPDAWFIVWDPEGEPHASVGSVPDEVVWIGERRTAARTQAVGDGLQRWVTVPGPHRTTLQLGRSVSREFDELRWLAIRIAAVGVGVLAVGIASGWWLTRRIVRPLDVIAGAAESISAEQLDARIDTAEMDEEIARLGAVLNTTFARLERSFEQQTRFTADASHELRTPLSVLLSRCELALSRERSPSDYRDALTSIHAAGRRMKTLVDELLELARLDAGAVELAREDCALDDVVGEALELLAETADGGDVTLDADVTPLVAHVDEQRCHQIVVNLVRNALQHTPRGGRVDVTLARDADDALLTVADTGEGIPPEHLQAIFTRFHRADASRQRGSGGTGLGLAITRALVEAHGGEIAVQSEPGRGTTFTVRLPLGDVPASVAAPDAAPLVPVSS